MEGHGHYIAAPVQPGDLVLGPGEVCVLRHLVLPGEAAGDIHLRVHLAGEGAQLRLYGLYLCGGQDRLNFHTEVFHEAPGCFSDQQVRGLVAGAARTAFSGLIVVAPGAQQTQAYQANHNLLLSSDAQADTRPQLEIYADDVKCSHGATVGNLSEEEQFYMRSRGIPQEEARILQILSFAAPFLEGYDDARERKAVAARIEKAIRALAREGSLTTVAP